MSDAGRVQVGHPVDVGSGAVFTAMVDADLPGTLPLAWRRFYSTDLEFDGWLGRGWTVPWFSYLERVREGYLLRDENARLLLFPVDGIDLPIGGRIMSYGANMELVRHADRFVIDHWHHGTDDVERFCFPLNGTYHMPLGWLENLSGHRIVVGYDQLGRPARLRQELEERQLEIIYGPNDLIQAIDLVTDGRFRRRLVRYEYDGARRLVAALDALEQRTSYQYDAQHRLVRETNALGSSFEFRYDPQGRCVYTTGDGGYLERRLRYASAPPSTRVTDSLGNVTTYILNLAGQVVQQISPSGGITTTEYDEFGRPISVRDALGAVIAFEYDARGDRSAVVHQDGTRSETPHNEFHMLREYVDPSGATWAYSYNERGEVIGLTTPLGHQYSAVRDARGLVVETQTPTGRRLRFRHGPALRWCEAYDDISLLTRTEYDDAGNQVAIYDAQGLVQRAEFDPLDRPILLDDGAGRTYQVGWNALGELTGVSGPGIPWEQRVYDTLGQVVAHVNPVGTMRQEYDTEGRITRVTNRAGEQLVWTYDVEGRIVREIGFDGRTELFEYDALGRPITITKPDGRQVRHAYNAFGAILRRASSDGDTSEFAYDVNGRLLEARNDVAEILLERDADGRVTAESQNGRRIEYPHDADGDRSGRRIPGVAQGVLAFVRDARKQLVGVTDESGPCVDLRWDSVGRLTERQFAGSVSEQRQYDARGRLTAQSVRAAGSTTVAERRYEFDDEDYLVAVNDRNGGRATFRRDEIGRLAEVSRGGRTVESYAYGDNDAIVATHRGQRVLGPGGALLAEGARRYEYAEDGTVRRVTDAAGTVLLTHDTDGQITSAALPDGSTVRYGYDPLGRRVWKDVNGARTEFLWEGPVLAAEFANGGAPLVHLFFAFEPLVRWSGTQRRLVVTELSGMPREMLDEQGRLVWVGRFDAYGNRLEERGVETQRNRFRGQYFDAEIGLHYNFYRSYDPIAGDYSARDPIGVEGGANFYAYPRNPLLWDDPFGLSCSNAHSAEQSMDGFYGAKGYKKIGARGKPTSANGIDAIYYKKGGKPPYIIAEAKSGGAHLGTDQHGNQQMSDAWINGRPADRGQPRLDGAFPPGSKWPDRIDAASEKGNVGKVVYNPDKDPKVQQTGTYGGRNSSTTTF